jgi:hypothetical protein
LNSGSGRDQNVARVLRFFHLAAQFPYRILKLGAITRIALDSVQGDPFQQKCGGAHKGGRGRVGTRI